MYIIALYFLYQMVTKYSQMPYPFKSYNVLDLVCPSLVINILIKF